MGFLDLFRPKWRHSNVEVRMDAVRALDDADLSTLGEVIRRDPDPRVRRLALKKIDDPELLQEVARGDVDDALRRAAEGKASELLVERASTARDEAKARRALELLAEDRDLAMVAREGVLQAIRQEALARLSDAKAIGEVARRGEDVEIRRAALERLSDPDLLRDVALAEDHRALAAEVVARVEDREALQVIARDARSKSARQAAKEKLRTAAAAREATEEAAPEAQAPPSSRRSMSPVERKARKTKLRQLCLTAEAHSRGDDFKASARGLLEVRAEWEALDPTHQEKALWKRLQRQFSQLEERKAEKHRLLEAREREAREREVRRQEKAAAAASPPAPIVEAAEPSPAAPVEPEAPVGMVPTAPEPEGPTPELVTRWLTAVAEQLEKLIGPDRVVAQRLGELERRWAELDEPGETDEARQALRARFAAAREAVGVRLREAEERRQAQREAARKGLEEAIAEVERARAGDSLKKAEHAQKSGQQLLKQHRPTGDPQEKELRQQLGTALEQLALRVGELREAESWKRWHNQPKLEDLCKQAEALAEVVETVEDKRRVPAVLKELQSGWKEASRGAPSEKTRALWERFKKACDDAYDKSKAYFAKLDEERVANLASKEALCEKVEALKDSTDWKVAAEEIKRLQEEWRAIGPVPQDQGDAVWKRFRAACDLFFERRDSTSKERAEERAAHLAKKEALCAEVEALASSTDWKETAERIKRLQDEWQEIGPVPREQSDAVWKRFRAACDRFFDARKAAFAGADEARQANLKRKEELCVQAEALAGLADGEEARAQAKVLQAEWKKVGPIPREVDAEIWRRFRSACDRVFEGPAAAADADGDAPPLPGATGISGFVNRLPLAGVAEKLGVKEEVASGAAPSPSKEPESPDAAALDSMSKIDEGWD